MRKMTYLVAAVSVFIGASAFAFEGSKSEKTKLEATPSAVQAAIRKAVGTGKIGDVSKEVEEGKTVFEADFTVEKVKHSVKVSEKGEVLEEETDVDVASVPTAVTNAIKAKYADGKIENAELVKKGNKSYFELSVKVGDADHEVQVDSAGKVISDKVEAEDDEKDEQGEHEHK